MFREKVYQIAKQIPRGKVVTYGQLAQLAGSPKAARAVGSCMQKNTDPSQVPCHRIVASNGALTGYAFGGISAKKNILEKEGVIFKGNTVDLSVSQWKPLLQ